MAVLTQDRDTPTKKEFYYQSYKMAAVKIFQGGLVLVTNATGFAGPATDTAATTVVGVSKEQIDNVGGAAGAKEIVVGVGVYKFAHTNLVQADVGQNAFVVDDQTVTNAATAANDIVAGRILRLDSDGVWLRVGI